MAIKVLEFLGRLEYVNRSGDKERVGYYKVKNEKGVVKQFRLTVSNEKILRNKFKCNGYPDILGKLLVLQVKHYQLGSGFIVVDLKSEPTAPPKQPDQEGMQR